MFPSLVLSGLLLLLAGLLIFGHVRAWRASRQEPLDEKERDFAWRQFRRRMQASAMIAIVAIAIPLGERIRSPIGAMFYWGGVLLVVMWFVLLAVADAFVTRQHYTRLAEKNAGEIAQMHAELHKLDPGGQNGSPRETL